MKELWWSLYRYWMSRFPHGWGRKPPSLNQDCIPLCRILAEIPSVPKLLHYSVLNFRQLFWTPQSKDYITAMVLEPFWVL